MKRKLYLITILAIMLICLMPSLAFADSWSTRPSDGRFSVTLDNTNGDTDLTPGDLVGRVSSVPGAPDPVDIYELIIDPSINGMMNSTDFAYIESMANLEVLSVATTIVANPSDNFLSGNTSLTTLSFPAITVRTGFCSGCTSLTAVNLPSATSMGAAALMNCTSLSSVNVPNLLTLGNGVFSGCTALTSLSLPSATDLNSDDGTNTLNCANLTSLSLGSTPPDVSTWGASLPATRTVNVPDSTASAAYDADSSPDGDGLWEGWILSPAPGGESTGGSVVSNPQTGEALWFDGLVEWIIDIF